MITADTKARNPDQPETKAVSDGRILITPDIIVTLAITLPKEEIQHLKQWFRQNVDPQTILKLRQEAELIGGCRIIWQGVEGDFSLRKKFRKKWKTEN